MSDVISYSLDGLSSTRSYTQDEFADIAASQPTANDLIKQQIAALESTVTERRYREAVLGVDDGWLKNLNDQIVSLRSQLTE